MLLRGNLLSGNAGITLTIPHAGAWERGEGLVGFFPPTNKKALLFLAGLFKDSSK